MPQDAPWGAHVSGYVFCFRADLDFEIVHFGNKGIVKSVADIMEGARYTPGRRSKQGGRKVAEPKLADYADDVIELSPKELSKKIRQMEEQMHQHARDLEFEQAAALRDQLRRLKEQAFVAS